MKLKTISLSAAALLMTACATNSGANYTPIVDGPYAPNFGPDLAECQTLSKEHALLNGNTQNDMLIDAVLGGLLGSADGDAVEGALVGAAAGGGSGAYEAHKERKDVVINCMRGRGHRIVG